MSDAEAYKPMTTWDLSLQIERFISDGSGSRDVAVRWLATRADEWLSQARQVRRGSLNKETIVAVNEFRLAEIAVEQSRLHRDVEQLEREAKRLRTADEAIP